MVSFQMLPEWESTQAVLLAWPFPNSDWAANYDEVVDCYWLLLEAITENAEAWVLLHPDLDLDLFQDKCSKLQNTSNIRVRNNIAYNDTWIRDYGPLSCNNGLVKFRFNGWGGKYSAIQDNLVATVLDDWFVADPHVFNVVCEGGALEVNSKGVLLANQDCVVDDCRNRGISTEDLENYFREAIGVSHFAWLKNICLTNDDTDGHIDTIARFASDNTIVYSGRNTEHHDAAALDDLHFQLQTLAQQHHWQCYELPTPVVRSSVDGRLLPATYTNFLICNNAVLLPMYGGEEDAMAAKIMAQAFPHHVIRCVPCAPLLEQHGSLHCATMQIAKQSLNINL